MNTEKGEIKKEKEISPEQGEQNKREENPLTEREGFITSIEALVSDLKDEKERWLDAAKKAKRRARSLDLDIAKAEGKLEIISQCVFLPTGHNSKKGETDSHEN